MRYRLLVFAIASHNGLYDRFASIWKAYMNSRPWIRSFLIYGDAPKLRVTYDELHLPVNESWIPGILHKTIWAMRWAMEEGIQFDYMLRTNLSSFWILDRIPKCLELLPDERVGMSHHLVPLVRGDVGIYNGSGMFFSYDVVKFLCEIDDWRYQEPDDREISRQAYKMGTRIYSKHHYQWLSDSPKQLDVERNLNNIDHSNVVQIRVQNPRPRELYKDISLRVQIDVPIHIALYYHYYAPDFKTLIKGNEKLAQKALFFVIESNVDLNMKKFIESSPCKKIEYNEMHPLAVALNKGVRFL